jgi:hypothetical protein
MVALPTSIVPLDTPEGPHLFFSSNNDIIIIVTVTKSYSVYIKYYSK